MAFSKKPEPKSERFKDVEYATLEDPGTRFSSPPHPDTFLRPKAWSFLSGICTALLVLLLASLAFRFFTPTPKTAQQLEDEDWNHCGRSSAVAIERGCVMEPYFYGWLPARCQYPELSDKFKPFSDRKWYKDHNKTIELPEADLWAGKYKMVYTEKYHGEHCLFQWRKLQYTMQNRKEWVDNRTISEHHGNHCADQMSKKCEEPGDVSAVELGFYRCRKPVW